jgi:hypothetical protein
MFSFKNGPADTEAVSSASEFPGSTLIILDNDRTLVYGTDEEPLLCNGFTKESTNYYAYSLSIRSCLIFLIPLLKSL